MTAIIGFIVLVIFALWVTAIWAIAAFNNLGRYNIGGADNSLATKLTTVAAFGFVILAWTVVAESSPFTVGMK